MKRILYRLLFFIYWLTLATLFILPGVVYLIVTGKDVWNPYMDKMYLRFKQI